MRVPGWPPPKGLRKQWFGYQKLSRTYVRIMCVCVCLCYYSVMTERLFPAAGQIDN